MSRPEAQRDLRLAAAWAVAAAGLVALTVLQARQHPTLAAQPPVVQLGAVPVAVLDTVAFQGRTVRASLGGTVVLVDAAGRAWVEARGRAFPVALGDSAGVHVEDRVLVAGRLRGDRTGRWLDAEAWTLVESVPRVLPSARERFGPAPDRSAPGADRSSGTP